MTANIRKLGFTTLPHPPYSPSDFYILSPMKCILKGKNYKNENKITGDFYYGCLQTHRDFSKNRLKFCFKDGNDC